MKPGKLTKLGKKWGREQADEKVYFCVCDVGNICFISP